MNIDKTKDGHGAERELQLFVQGEDLGEIRVVKVADGSTVSGLINQVAAKFGGEFAAAVETGGMVVTLEDDEKELSPEDTLKKAGVAARSRVHIHRCRRVKVSVNFNGETADRDFPPSTTVRKVKKWADRKFEIDRVDATEHALQLCGTAERPDEDRHIGSLTNKRSCSVCFDLVPKRRVEGASN